jgi:hypothetical protein
MPDADLFPAFRTLRPVIMSGWEMPILLRAIVRRSSESAIVRNWDEVRDGLVRSERLPGADLVRVLQRTLDDVRREWIGAERDDWLSQHLPLPARRDASCGGRARARSGRYDEGR